MQARASATGLSAAVAITLALLMMLGRVADQPVAAQVSGNSYTNPTYGYSLTWDETVWKVDASGAGDLTLTAGAVSVTLQSGQFYRGDASACRDDLLSKLPGADNVESVRPYNGGAGVSGESDGRAFATSFVQLTGDADIPSQVVETIDCRTLVDGEAVLAIISTAPVAQFDTAYATIQTLLGTLSIPSSALSDAVEGVSGSTYTDPRYGFQIAWDPKVWSYARPVGGILGLNDTQSVINFDVPEAFGDDLGACIGGTRQTIQSNPGLQQLADLMINGDPVRGSDRTGWSYAAYSANYGGATRFVEVLCAAIGDGAVVLRAVFSGPADAYAAEADRADPVFGSLRLSEAAGTPGAGTPGVETQTAGTPVGGTPGLAPVAGATPSSPAASAGSPAASSPPTTVGTAMATATTAATPTTPVTATVTATLAPTETVTVPATATATTAPSTATATTPATATAPLAASPATAVDISTPTRMASQPPSPDGSPVAGASATHGGDRYAAMDGSWSIRWDASVWRATDTYTHPDAELTVRSDASEVTFARASLPAGDLADTADRLATDDVVAAGTSLRDVVALDPPPTGGIAGASGVAYQFVTRSGAVVVEAVVLMPLSDGQTLVIRIYSTTDGYTADRSAIGELLANLVVTV